MSVRKDHIWAPSTVVLLPHDLQVWGRDFSPRPHPRLTIVLCYESKFRYQYHSLMDHHCAAHATSHYKYHCLLAHKCLVHPTSHHFRFHSPVAHHSPVHATSHKWNSLVDHHCLAHANSYHEYHSLVVHHCPVCSSIHQLMYHTLVAHHCPVHANNHHHKKHSLVAHHCVAHANSYHHEYYSLVAHHCPVHPTIHQLWWYWYHCLRNTALAYPPSVHTGVLVSAPVPPSTRAMAFNLGPPSVQETPSWNWCHGQNRKCHLHDASMSTQK